MTPDEIKKRYGEQCASDNRFTRQCRMLQSWYRVEVLKAQDGKHSKSGTRVGSSLVNGEASTKTFLSKIAFDYAKERIAAQKTNPKMTIESFRLFNNMLSSMPMCFNLFSDLRKGILDHDQVASEILAAMFPESRIGRVTEVEVEVVPKEGSLGDKTAFDALVTFDGKYGQGIAAIETKYSDKLGTNAAGNAEKQIERATELGLLTPEGISWFEEKPFDQIARNFLLTVSYAREKKITNFINYVLAPQADTKTPQRIERFWSFLTENYREKIVFLSLEELICRGVSKANARYTSLLREFRRRYLDFDQIKHLLVRP